MPKPKREAARTRRRKVRKNIAVGNAYIKTSFNNTLVTLTDKEERLLGSLCVLEDDIFSPRLELYLGASLIYSIRPPLEMQLAIGLLAAGIGADVLIRPLMDEIADLPGFARRLVNSGQARFYLFKMP